MKAKYKILVAISIVLIILLIIYGVIGTINFIRDYNYINNSAQLEEIDTYLKYKTIKVGDPCPVFRDFVSNGEIDGTIRIYDGDILISEDDTLNEGVYRVVLNINGKNEEAELVVSK